MIRFLAAALAALFALTAFAFVTPAASASPCPESTGCPPCASACVCLACVVPPITCREPPSVATPFGGVVWTSCTGGYAYVCNLYTLDPRPPVQLTCVGAKTVVVP